MPIELSTISKSAHSMQSNVESRDWSRGRAMATYPPTHIRIPKNHADFESKSAILFRILLEDPSVKKLGRSGQKQFGVDLIGYRKQDIKRPVGIQCKKKKPTEKLTAK